ncbi:MS4A13 protein, isoform CRA_a [Homo sapiens]|uniref:Membrane-spanning 4-domains subfamily A member 14 n=2 Tax=Homo sapiens TaxID=9606 RepID=M4A14_HUMAN|nr:membrane-spanning 4-domains subfamily A member 14 isoform 1 [Homo sapiens]Q96JA4.2 RecName: Full=Membrane-spanning 4-domains subfamily A member 14; AltName: Full=Testis development protein NYD-SP21 [Homo sapiens]AAI60053.1 Membrane-spanning 4-domains, subfamily A, member 14 [synthetic construct]EAW73884.1 MS4A13 protein, isoform CRA_a [Homo sapiens]|eukprot:NP_115986.3 membrane-spanning 4-domains subfamily A member 14 isoform 1 [Homo sapiens]
MESTSQDRRATHVITIKPNETVLTAFPYRPHSSLLDFLKGEPRVLGATQILLALIIVGFGTIFALNYIGFSQRLPLVVLTGYPFWGALIFILTGYLTVTDKKSKLLGQGVTGMNVISSLVAITGITFTILSYRHQDKYCQMPSFEEICVFSRTLFIVLFFLPSDVTQNSEQPAPEENDQLQFVLQEEFSSDDSTTNAQSVIFGGYAFFKLTLSRSPLVSQPGNKGREFVPDEQKQSILPSPKFSEEEIEPLPPTLEKKPSENMSIQLDSTFKQMKDEDLQSAIVQPSQMQTKLLQDQAASLQVFPSHSALKLEDISPEDLPSQALPVEGLSEQTMPSKSTSSHVKQSSNLTANDLPPQGILSQDTSSQDMLFHDMTSQDMQSLDMLSQDTPSHAMPPQDIPSQDMLSQALSAHAILPEASTSHIVQFPEIQHLLQQPPDLQPENTEPQNQQILQMSYQDIRSEVMEETKEWKSEEELHRRKSSRRHSLNQQTKALQYLRRHSLDVQAKGQKSSKRHSLDQQSKGWQSPKQKSLDQQIKDWLSPKRHSVDKQAQLNQTKEQLPDQQAEDQQAKGEQYPEGQSKDGQVKDQQTDKEQNSKKQTQDQQTEDQPAQEKKSPKGQFQNVQAEGQQAQVEKVPKLLCQDSESQIQQYQFWQFHKGNLQAGQPRTVNLLAKNPLTG